MLPGRSAAAISARRRPQSGGIRDCKVANREPKCHTIPSRTGPRNTWSGGEPTECPGVGVHGTGPRCTGLHRFKAAAIFYPISCPNRQWPCQPHPLQSATATGNEVELRGCISWSQPPTGVRREPMRRSLRRRLIALSCDGLADSFHPRDGRIHGCRLTRRHGHMPPYPRRSTLSAACECAHEVSGADRCWRAGRLITGSTHKQLLATYQCQHFDEAAGFDFVFMDQILGA